VKCNWKEASLRESAIEMTESDIDRDGEKEVLVIQHNNTGLSSGEDEFHLLDRTENDSFTDEVIPMDDFWKWVKEISSGWLNSAEIEDLYLYTTTVTESGLTIEAEMEKTLLHPLGKISVQMGWSDKTLQVRSFTFTTDM
jgi:Fe-S cluster assembly iron-binding protein IscA